MSDMEAAIRLRLINDLRGPARDAENDLDRLREAARKLDGASGGDKLAADLAKIERQAGEAKVELDQMERAARQLGTGAGRDLLDDLGKVERQAGEVKAELAEIGRVARQLGTGGGGLDALAGDAGKASAAVREIGTAARDTQQKIRLDGSRPVARRPQAAGRQRRQRRAGDRQRGRQGRRQA